ncbi:MAG: leucine-rich repeat domain-containing protein [Muribaculaceae bacterium]|nr:leucine-rich repeat domain-containing protein [Muribaculaceae bacterium]
MNRTITSVFMAFVPLGFLSASAAGFSEGGLNYTVLSENEKTVSIVQGSYAGDIVIPSTVTSDGTEYTVVAVGDKAFESSKITSVILPETLTSIGKSAFYDCWSVKSITIPAGVTSIGQEAFCYCSGLTSLEMPDALVSLGAGALQGCSSLKSLKFGDALTAIPQECMVSCYALTDVSLPASLKTIQPLAFNYCESLGTLTLPDGVTEIGDLAFTGCGKLKNIGLGKSLKTLGNSVFEECESLEAVILPATLTSIGTNCFKGCKALDAINVAEGSANFASYDGVLYSAGLQTLLMAPSAKVTVAIPDQTEKIGTWAFAGCVVETVTGGRNLTEIGEFAFSGCRTLKNITLGNKLIALQEEAFSSTSITSLALPESLEILGIRAFNDCRSLKEIVVPGKVTDVGNYCFFGCQVIESITLGKNVRYIGEYAFRNCPALTSLICKGSVPPSHDDFTDVQFASVTLYVPEKALNTYKTTSPWSKFQTIEAFVDRSLSLSVNDITASAVNVLGQPTDNSVYWYADVVAKADYPGENVWSALVEEWKAVGEDWYKTYCDKANTGEKTLNFTDLKEDTEYVAYGFAVDSNGALCMPLVAVDFTTDAVTGTLALTASDITVDGVKITGKPSDDTIYWYADVVAKADYYGENIWVELLKEWQAAGEDWYKTYCDKANTGEKTLNFTDLKEDTEYVAYGFAVNSKGTLCMPFVSVRFKTEKTESVDQISDSALRVSAADGAISIQGDFIEAAVYAVDGRQAGAFRGNSCTVAQLGVYVVRIRTSEQVVTKTVFVK